MSGDSEVARPSGGRRRRANVAGGMPVRHEVKMTVEEEARLVVLAKKQGVTVPRLLVESALGGGVETVTQRHQLLTEFYAARRLLAAVSNNLNQLTKVANATGEIHAEAVPAIRKIAEVVARVDQLAEEVGQA
jgi:Bacterial mobilisation protein (MobC)